MTENTDATADPGDGDALGYAAAMAELEQLLADLERADLDVDQLGAKVARAAELIRSCRARITTARLEVEQIVADLDEPPLP
jgi:exodeoxyribonuclease VII small subunit